MNGNNVLTINNLCVTLFTEKQELPAVSHVTLHVKEGKTLGIVGESGCGKSMLASAIIGLISHPGKITEGQILFEGKDLTEFSQKQLREIRGAKISMIFQEPMTSLNPLMKCGKQITECILAHQKITKKEADAKALEMIKSVGIQNAEKVFNQVPFQLSGGMRQRIMIAMALICKPRLLICDEPTTALDVTVQSQILKLIRHLQKETGTAVIFISHDMGVISEMSDNVAVMYAGHLIEYGSADEIFKNPQHPYTKGLQAAIPKLEEDSDRLETIAGNVPMLDSIPDGCVFAPRCAFATAKCRENRPALSNSAGGHKTEYQSEHITACFYPLNNNSADREKSK
ncbi:MAG: ABC transporter ATP-binding protein [Treponema sp.]|nr:ABC transporter ATP-binding protein [Treponema sp.]